MQTEFMWDELLKAKEVPFDMPENGMDCVRIEQGDHFDVWVPNEKRDGGSLIYRLLVSEVKYHFDQTFGEPKDVTQCVFLTPIPEPRFEDWSMAEINHAIKLTELQIKRREANVEEQWKLLQLARDRGMSLTTEALKR